MDKIGLSLIASAMFLATSTGATAAEPHYQLAFTSFAPMGTGLFLADADGSNAQPFVPGAGMDFDATFSADGRWVIFSSSRGGSIDIYRAHPDGSGLARLIDDPAYDAQPALSPNGKTLAFVSSRSGNADIWLMDMKSRAVRNLTRNAAGDFRPAWSPDGKRLAFSTDRDSTKPGFPKGDFVIRHSTEIYVVRADGGGLERLTHEGEFAGSPAWSPDGKSLVFYTASIEQVAKLTGIRRLGGTTQLVTLELATGKRAVITTGEGEKFTPRWLGGSPARIGYADAGKSGGIGFTAGPAGARGIFREPAWSRDGKRLVFQRDAAENWPPHVPMPSRDPRFSLVRVGVFASYSPDGQRRVSNDQSGAALHNAIILMNADGSDSHPIFRDEKKNAMGPSWSHDGQRIAFSFGQFFQILLGPSLADIATVDTSGGNLVILTDGKANYALPSWSPDGKRIAYRRAGPNGNALEIIDVTTRAQHVLVSGDAHFNQPAWSPNSERIAFMADIDGDYELYAIDSDGTHQSRLTNSPGHDAHESWSPDGQWIAFTTGRGGFKDECPLRQGNPQAYGEIAVMRADGSDVHLLTDNAFEDGTPTWIPGGS